MYNTAILLREVSHNTCTLIIMTRSPAVSRPGQPSGWQYRRDQGVPGFMRGYRIPSHTIPDHHQPHHQICHRRDVTSLTLRKHSSFLHLISRNRHPIHSLSILPPPSLCLSFSLRRRLNALLWQLIHTFAVEEEKQSFWRKTLRALQTQS